MDDVDPEKSFTSGSNETLNCTFYSNPAVASVMWHDGPDDQGELILTDGLEPNAEDVYISILYLVNVMHNRTVTCVATRVNHKKMEARKIREITAEDTFTFYIHITNEGMRIICYCEFHNQHFLCLLGSHRFSLTYYWVVIITW